MTTNETCTGVYFLSDDYPAPASIERCHSSRWMTEVAADPSRLRYFCSQPTIKCGGGPPICKFGEYGCEAEHWWSKTSTGVGGSYGMCGHRPYTTHELAMTWAPRGDHMGPRPGVDRVNVVPCDGTLTGDAILFGPIDIARGAIRDASGDPDDISRGDGAMLQYTITGRRYRRSVPKLQNLPPHSELLGSSTALQRAVDAGHGAATCRLLGVHKFDGNTCARCGTIRIMLEQPNERREAKERARPGDDGRVE